MLDGSAAGLQRAADLRKEAESRKAAQMSRLAAFSTEESGRNATTIYRDKSGRKVDIAARKAEDLAEQRKRDAEEASRMVWGQGVAQHRQMEANAERLAREGGKPFARYVDDVDMNEEMMERDRWGDPMAGKVSKKKKVQRPLYKGPPAPPNRFGILPGYRWDGVLRDNGFEKKLFEARNDKLVQDETAYRWGAEDM
jgi:pre-mRNA-splicing factor CWC26